MLYEVTNSDQFLAPYPTESYRKRQDLVIRFGHFRSHGFDRILSDPTRGYKRETAESVGIRRQQPTEFGHPCYIGFETLPTRSDDPILTWELDENCGM